MCSMCSGSDSNAVYQNRHVLIADACAVTFLMMTDMLYSSSR